MGNYSGAWAWDPTSWATLAIASCLLPLGAGVPMHNAYFVKYGVTGSFLAQVLDTVTYFVSQEFENH